jgi:hypothetical protein
MRNLTLQGTRAGLEQERQLSDLGTSRTRSQRSLGEEAMRSGLGRSGWLSRQDAEGTQDYLRSYEDLQTGYEQQGQDRETAMSDAIAAYIAGEGGFAEEALGRFTAGQGQQAAEGLGILNPKDIRRLNQILGGKKKKGKKGKGGQSGPAGNRRYSQASAYRQSLVEQGRSRGR